MKNKNIIWGVILSYINVLISILYGFISVPILLDALGQSEYGVYSTIISMISYMSIMDFGIHNVLVRYLTKYRVQNDRKAYENLLAIAFVIYGFIAAILFGIGMGIYRVLPNMFAASFSTEEITIAKKIFWIVLLDMAVSLPGAVFQCVMNAEEHFIVCRLTIGVKQLLKLLIIIFVSRMGGKSLAFAAAVFCLNMGVILIQAIYAVSVLHMRVRLHVWNWGYIRTLFIYTSYVFIATVADQILWKLDSVILGMRISASVVAIYAVAMNLVTIFKKFSGAVSGIFLPRATAMSITDNTPEASVRLMVKVGLMQNVILSLALIGFGLIGKEFILVWLGEGYDDIYLIFLILCGSMLIPSCQSIGINILEARNRHRFRAVVLCFLAILNLITTYIAVGRFGMIGAAACTAAAVVIGQVGIINIYYKKALGMDMKVFFRDTFLRLALPIMIGGVAAWIVWHMIPLYGNWMSIAVKVVALSLAYIIVIAILSGKYICKVYGVKLK